MNLVEPTSYSSAEVCRLARITYRQLDYWSTLGLLCHSGGILGSGVPRSFSPVEVRVAAAIGAAGVAPSSKLAGRIAAHVRRVGLVGELSDGCWSLRFDLIPDPLGGPAGDLAAVR